LIQIKRTRDGANKIVKETIPGSSGLNELLSIFRIGSPYLKEIGDRAANYLPGVMRIFLKSIGP
jgi:hypothetical protein